MSATTLTPQAAKNANIPIIQNGKGTQAVHDVVVAYRANRRSGTACTKTKGEVALSGAKPWRQKGTGRARAGYKSSPIWRGGGVVFGPKPRDYSKNIPKKVKKLAFRKALSERILAGDVLLVDQVSVPQPKTKLFVAFLRENSLISHKALIIANSFDSNTFLAARNYPYATLARAADVNTEQLLAFDKILVTKDALETLSKRANP
ncbi:MAG: 50S ribosomal protein L4 [Chthoniobacterales bacterium]|nr:50S ribosomal protein L4 [Chthoniobacterales bacterium]